MANFFSTQNSPSHTNVATKEQNHENHQESVDLPSERGWLNDQIYQYKGTWYSTNVLQGLLVLEQHQFEPKPNSVLLASYPKSGTTWLKALLFAITNRSQYDYYSTHPLLSSNPHELVPHLEAYAFMHPTNPTPNTCLIQSHLVFNALPESITGDDSKCKIVCVSRCKRCVGFFLYEDLKKDPLFNAKRIAEFLGQPFSLEKESEGIVERLIELCSFEKQSNLEVNKEGTYSGPFGPTSANNIYFRQGKVGDFKNHLSKEMIEVLDDITKQKLGFDLMTTSVTPQQNGETINDNDMMEKTLSTFHASNVLLQRQYREKGLKKYTKMSSHLLVAEQNNDLLMKNHENRPTGSAPLPEVNDVHVHHARRRKDRCPGRGRSRGHYSCDCRALKHLVDLSQASLKMKERNPEANFLSENAVDITSLDVTNFFEHPEEKIDHLIGDGFVNMEE
ncbi:putative isoaspartyl peptidase/L-asparaginase-like [Capsicum annuum]|nr:putative isoaspartyl peptidase/L-asparaginase-like [Capsicum annuum]